MSSVFTTLLRLLQQGTEQICALFSATRLHLQKQDFYLSEYDSLFVLKSKIDAFVNGVWRQRREH